MLAAQFGAAAAQRLLADQSLLEQPFRLRINAAWDAKPATGWRAPPAPLLAARLNETAAADLWPRLDAATSWAKDWCVVLLGCGGGSGLPRDGFSHAHTRMLTHESKIHAQQGAQKLAGAERSLSILAFVNRLDD
jgi:hypothetical protein